MCDAHALPARPHRRELLSATVMGGLAAMLAGAGTRPAWAAESAAEKLGPRESLDQLYAGNRRFVAGQTLAPNRDIHGHILPCLQGRSARRRRDLRSQHRPGGAGGSGRLTRQPGRARPAPWNG